MVSAKSLWAVPVFASLVAATYKTVTITEIKPVTDYVVRTDTYTITTTVKGEPTTITECYTTTETTVSYCTTTLTTTEEKWKTDYETISIEGPTTTISVVGPKVTVTAPGETVYGPGETIYKPGETIYKPGETVYKPGETVYQPGETIYKPGETIYKPTTCTETQLVPTTIILKKYHTTTVLVPTTHYVTKTLTTTDYKNVVKVTTVVVPTTVHKPQTITLPGKTHYITSVQGATQYIHKTEYIYVSEIYTATVTDVNKYYATATVTEESVKTVTEKKPVYVTTPVYITPVYTTPVYTPPVPTVVPNATYTPPPIATGGASRLSAAGGALAAFAIAVAALA